MSFFRVLKISPVIASLALAACGGGGGGSGSAQVSGIDSKAGLGEKLFADINLSLNRAQSCASCHNPEHAFIDNRLDSNQKIVAGSTGDDEQSIGDRNAPTAGYAAFSPDFHQGTRQRFNSLQGSYTGALGGQFWDGRQLDLKGQASGPPLAKGEMNLPTKAVVSERLQENPEYITAFKKLYGSTVFDSADSAFDAMTDSIASFEKTTVFAPFSSKYDKSLRGEYSYSPLSKAGLGKALFFSKQFTNCASCHQLKSNGSSGETFTSYEYHNIGVPKNEALRAINGKAEDFIDEGLLENTSVTDVTAKGKFKVPTLRNIAVTEPYMHNGVFRDLKTVVEFYDHFQAGSTRTINPETGLPWRAAEVAENQSTAELQDGRILSDSDVEALVCFMRTLTDERYEALIQSKGIDCDL